MPQGPLITDEVKILAARLHREHPKWTNAMIRNEIRAIVHRNDKSLPKNWPSKYAIDRIMPGVRERAKLRQLNPDDRDRPWTLQSMNVESFLVPPASLPAVLQVWHFMSESTTPLTIREAQWIGRLYAAISNTENLCAYSRFLAAAERLAEDAGITDFTGSEVFNLYAFSTMTGHAITHDEERRLARWSEEEWEMIRQSSPVIQEEIRACRTPATRILQMGITVDSDAATVTDDSVLVTKPTERAYIAIDRRGQNERSDLLQSKHRGPGKRRHKSRKPKGSVSEEGKRA